MRRAASVAVLSLALAGCIKVPDRVKLAFCAQPAASNHFGSATAARSCCPGPPRVARFGHYSEPCSR
jgi:starvation-inducible outer membrane lipoprotein